MNVLSHKSINQWIRYPGVLVGGSQSYFPVTKTALTKKNATRLLCCLSMWKCNVRKGLNLQRTKEKEAKWQWRHWQSHPIYPHCEWATCTGESNWIRRSQKHKGGWREGEIEMNGGREDGLGQNIGGQKEGARERERRRGKVMDRGREMTLQWASVTWGLFFSPAKLSEAAWSPFSARKPETAVI